MPPRLRPLAGAVREDPVQHVERLAHLLRVRVGTEVHDAAPVPLPREHHARILVLNRDGDIGKGLVVPEPDVERRPVPLDEILLEMERLDLVLGDDDLDVLDPIGQLLDRRASVGALLEVGPHPGPQRLRLADVQHLAGPVPKQVNPGPRRHGLQLFFELGRHQSSLALKKTPKAEASCLRTDPHRPDPARARRVPRAEA